MTDQNPNPDIHFSITEDGQVSVIIRGCAACAPTTLERAYAYAASIGLNPDDLLLWDGNLGKFLPF